MIRNKVMAVAKYLVFLFLLSGVWTLPATNHTCQHDKFPCGNGACIPINWRCDGEIDCKNEADEQDCDDTSTCSGGAFQCSSGTCVPHRWRCDGELDCNDGSDEQNCSSIDSGTTLQLVSLTSPRPTTSVTTTAQKLSTNKGHEILGPDSNCRDEQLNCQVLVADIDICSMPASAQLLCASTCHMCSGSPGSHHVTNSHKTTHSYLHSNPGHPTSHTTEISTTEMSTSVGNTHAPYTAPPTKELVASGCVDAEDNCEHLVKTVNICNDPIKAEFLCQRTCSVCGSAPIIESPPEWWSEHV